MTRLLLLAPFALVALVATPALAQAPGDCACAAPAPAAIVVVEAPRKIGVSLRLSALGMHPNAAPDDHRDLSGGGLAVSYRFARRWGVEVAAEQFSDETTELQAMSLSATFHLRPRARWDGYLIAGVDAVGEVGDNGTQLGGAHVGAGLERRVGRLGLSAEIRMLGLSEAETEDAAAPKMDTTATTDGISGGQVSLAATYYF